MKRLIYILLLIVLSVSCSVDHETERVLSQVSELIERNSPDSAMILLDSIKTRKPELAKKYQMRYELLRAQAMNKLFIPMDTVTVMDTVMQYYESQGNHVDKMMANYMMGCVHRDKGNSPVALEYYRKAISLADTTKLSEVRTASRIYAQMAELFNRQHAPQYELEAERNAIKMAWKAKDTLTAIRFHEFLAGAYYLKGDKDSAILVSNQASALYRKFGGYDDMAARAQSTSIQIHLECKDYEKAMPLIMDFERHSGLFDEKGDIATGYELFYYLKGLYYEGVNRYDSASYFYMKLLPFHDDISKTEAAYKGLTSLYTRLGQLDSVAKYSKLYCEVNDSSNLKSSSQEIIRMQSLYNYTESQRISMEKEKEAERYKSMLILLFIVIILSVYLIYRFISSQRKKAREAMIAANIQYANLLSEYQQARQDMDALQSGYEHYQSEKLKDIEKLQEMLAVYHDDGFTPEKWDIEQTVLNSEIVKRMRYLSNRGKTLSDMEKEYLREFASKHFPDFYNRISNHHILTEKEIDVCILIKFRFIPTEIATLLDMTKQRITNIRNTINWKLFKNKGAKSLDANIRRI